MLCLPKVVHRLLKSCWESLLKPQPKIFEIHEPHNAIGNTCDSRKDTKRCHFDPREKSFPDPSTARDDGLGPSLGVLGALARVNLRVESY